MYSAEYYDLLNSAEAGDYNSKFCLADCLLGDVRGNQIEGFPYDPGKAESLFEAVIKYSNKDDLKQKSYSFLATEYEFGQKLPKDLGKAIEYFKNAMELGDDFSEKKYHELVQKRAISSNISNEKSGPCYVATCVYGSYDSPEVITLRRFRDTSLNSNWTGRKFVQIYYALSPKVVNTLGKHRWFNIVGKTLIGGIVKILQKNSSNELSTSN